MSSPLLLAPPGTRIAMMWDTRTVDVGTIKGLLLAFDRVAVVAQKDIRLLGGPRESAQWKTMESMGLVAAVGVMEAVAVAGAEPLRALFDALHATGSPGRFSGRDAQWTVIVQAFRLLGISPGEMSRTLSAATDIRDVVAAIVCRLVEQALSDRGVTATTIISDRSGLAAFTTMLNRLGATGTTVTLPPENVLPPCAEATVEEVVAARAAMTPVYRAYTDLLSASVDTLSRQPTTAAHSVDYSPNEIIGEARRLRRLLPGLPWSGRGYIGLGVVGKVCDTPSGPLADLLRAVDDRLPPGRGLGQLMAFQVEGAAATWI